MSTPAESKIRSFFESYVECRDGTITQQADETVLVTYPDEPTPTEYTYQPTVARKKKIPLIASGSPAFQQILRECQEAGVLCQIALNPKTSMETLLRSRFKDSPFTCQSCHNEAAGQETLSFCTKNQLCHHQINNAKITLINILKKEPHRYYQFYYAVTFHNKLRPKNEEIITVLADEKGVVYNECFSVEDILRDRELEVHDYKSKLKVPVFEGLKAAAEEKLKVVLGEKLALFDLTLGREKKAKLRSFDRRLRRERREQVISKTHTFDYMKWQANYEALLKREEESYVTTIAVKFINLLVVNTSKVKFEVTLDNKATLQSAVTVGLGGAPEATCPICRRTLTEGYATADSLYVCPDCTRQSVDTAKTYSKKAPLALDENLGEYFEANGGFVCAVCGKRHSRLLEFKCSHDNSSVCIYHYGVCDVCGRVFSKLNLTYTGDFQRQLCPKHKAGGR